MKEIEHNKSGGKLVNTKKANRSSL